MAGRLQLLLEYFPGNPGYATQDQVCFLHCHCNITKQFWFFSVRNPPEEVLSLVCNCPLQVGQLPAYYRRTGPDLLPSYITAQLAANSHQDNSD